MAVTSEVCDDGGCAPPLEIVVEQEGFMGAPSIVRSLAKAAHNNSLRSARSST